MRSHDTVCNGTNDSNSSTVRGDEASGEEDDVFFEADLFLNQEYVQQAFSFDSIDVSLLVSPSACTDFDLTGQILWPAAKLLAGYLAANPQWASDCNCALELGAGLGLVGCVAAHLCPALLTDHNSDVLSVLKRNVDLNRHQHGASCMLLDWTSEADIAAVKATSLAAGGFDLVLGADVCYGQQALPALFSCAAALLAHTPSAAFLLGYVSRAKVIDRLLPVEAERAGLTISEVPGTRVPVDGGLEGIIYHLHWP